MSLTNKVAKLWKEVKYETGKAFRTVGVPLSLIAGGYSVACQPPRPSIGGSSSGGAGSSCGDLPTEFPTETEAYADVKLGPNTKVLEATGELESVLHPNADNPTYDLSFFSNSPFLRDLHVGDIILAKPGRNGNPPEDGLLVRVQAIDGLTVYTLPTSLEEAIQEGVIRIRQPLTYNTLQQPLRREGGLETQQYALSVQANHDGGLTIPFDDIRLTDAISLNGQLDVKYYFTLELEIDNFKLQHARFEVWAKETATLKLHAAFNHYSSGEFADFEPIRFPPIVAGSVIIVPHLTIPIKYEAHGQLAVEGEVRQGAGGRFILENRRGDWEVTKDFKNNSGYELPQITGTEGAFYAYVKPRLTFEVYDVVGIFAGFAGYGGIDYDTQRTGSPLEIYAGFAVLAGFHGSVFGIELVDYEEEIYNHQKLLYPEQAQPRGEGEGEGQPTQDDVVLEGQGGQYIINYQVRISNILPPTPPMDKRATITATVTTLDDPEVSNVWISGLPEMMVPLISSDGRVKRYENSGSDIFYKTNGNAGNCESLLYIAFQPLTTKLESICLDWE